MTGNFQLIETDFEKLHLNINGVNIFCGNVYQTMN